MYTSVLGMMSGNQGGSAPVPTQSFNAANILGTAVPTVGDSQARPAYSAGGAGAKSTALVVVALIAIGYLVYHLNFEK